MVETRPVSVSSTQGEEYVRCTLCGADDAALLYNIPVKDYNRGRYARDSWPVVRCRSCGLIYCNPRIDAEARAAHYQFTNPGEQAFIQDWFIDNADIQQAQWQRILRVIQCYCPHGQLLDLGCGPGHFLAEARALGYEAIGQDISPVFRQIAADKHKISVYETLADVAAQHGRNFACATAFDVIEHHADPAQMVRDMRAMLRPGGLLVITTHDIGNWFAQRYGPNWRYLNPIGHLTYFTRDTLGALLLKHGFRIERWGGWHTIEARPPAEITRWATQSLRTLGLRGLLMYGYKPLAERFPALSRWELRLGRATLNHRKMMTRVGEQVIINDDMVAIARAV